MEKSKYSLVADPDYGFLRADPVPSPEEVERYYAEEFYSEKRFNDSSLEVQKEEQDFFDSRWEAMYQRCSGFFGGRSFSYFDIGCGFAQALLYFRNKGVTVSGLDPAPQGIEYAKKQGLEVFHAGIEDYGCVGDRRFDAVSLFNVLEHLRTPDQALRDIREKLLAKGGLLAVEVPNEFNDFQTAGNAEHNLGEWWVCPPNHLNYFSATTLKKLLDACGYRVVHCEASFPLEMFLLMGDVYVGDGPLGRQCHNKRVAFEYVMRKQGKGEKLARLYEMLSQLDLGRQVIAYATPKD